MCQDSRLEIRIARTALSTGDVESARSIYERIVSGPVGIHEVDDLCCLGQELGVIK